MKKTQVLFLFGILFILLIGVVSATRAQSSAVQSLDQKLAEKFSPILYFHPDEAFRPQPVEVLIDNARLRQDISYWFDINILNQVTLTDLFTYQDANYFLDVWYGSKGVSDYKNYSAHRAYYMESLSPQAGGPPPTAYARVIHDQANEKIVLQYWLFYFYNDWFNKHEGDWEFVQVILDKDQNPEWVILSQHHGGTRRTWNDTTIEGNTHPAVYVASGSHANYFWGDEIYPNGQSIGNERMEILDRTGSIDPTLPSIQLLPERDQLLAGTSDYPLLEWLVFSGNWGELAFIGDFGGPVGPADKGEQWKQAYEWGMAQPLDSDVWYQNRLKIEVLSPEAEDTKITLLSNQQLLDHSDQERNPAILHRDPKPGEKIAAQILEAPTGEFEIAVTVPVPQDKVIIYNFIVSPEINQTSFEIRVDSSEPPVLLDSEGNLYNPSTSNTLPATWDAPDLVWFAGYLPADQIIRGVLISLAAGILPSLGYAALLYWNDRYEKEPIKLVAAALLWGAIPALLVAFAVQLFFKLPAELSGPTAVEAVQAGVFTPLIEELLKGSIVLLIAFRYRREFDNTLDGVIYGGMVGFGYAMTGSTISYLGAFLISGYGGLGTTILVEGVFFGLNHAMYTAIFGAGLGYARLAEKRWVKILIPTAAFLLAAAANASHNMIVNNLLGLNVFTILLNWLGIGVIIIVNLVSLHHQRTVLQNELRGTIPDALLENLTNPRNRRISLKEAKRQGGKLARKTLNNEYQLLAEYAFKKMQHRKFPGDGLGDELAALQKKLEEFLSEFEITQPTTTPE